MTTDAGSLKKGDFIKVNDEIFQVQKFEHNFHGRGSATCRLKTKNIRSGNALEMSFRTADGVEILDVDTIKMQYLYRDPNYVYLMDNQTFEQHQVDIKLIGTIAEYLKEGDTILVLMYEGKALSIRPPQSVSLKVTEAEHAVKGDTATAAKKTVLLETGTKASVPLFIKSGDVIVINPETGEYVERINK